VDYKEHSACGVGFNVSLNNHFSHKTLQWGLKALVNLEHRGGSAADLQTGDGSGIMTDIPRALFGIGETDGLANLFLPKTITERVRALRVFEETFYHKGLQVVGYREIPVDINVLSVAARESRPEFLMAFIRRPDHCTTRYGFEKLLYAAKQLTRSRLKEAGIVRQFFFTSLSAGTVVYKALTSSAKLPEFYLDLQNAAFTTRFSLFHRRFSTNTATAWDTAQPFRMVAHNGEINTISSNRSWAYSRERAMGLREDELLTHSGISDSGSVNEMIEALTYLSSIPHPEDILAIMMPQTETSDPYYKFWGRAMEPWDGPALMTYSDGRTVGARLDRSGFRPCRWAQTSDHFYLSSEAGSFEIPEQDILQKGALNGGASISIRIKTSEVVFKDASRSRENLNATFDPRVVPLPRIEKEPEFTPAELLKKLIFFNYTDEDLSKIITPLVKEGKEGIGSMGDSARLAILSEETRSLYDFFYQRFAQVTNPPLDFLREKIVTDMSVILGRKPNIFEPKELLPLKIGVELPGPVLTLGQMAHLKSQNEQTGFEGEWPKTYVFDATFARADGVAGVVAKLNAFRDQAIAAVKRKVSIFIVSDKNADENNPPIPSILVLRSILQDMNHTGQRLRLSVVIETGEVKETHSLAVLTAFGAAAVCPYLMLELAKTHPIDLLGEATGSSTERELTLVRALELGLLKIMSKAGVSSFRAYQGSELFTILGFSPEVHQRFFPRQTSAVGGLYLKQIIDLVLKNSSGEPATETHGASGLIDNFLYKEHLRARVGERHSMTLSRSKTVHKLIKTPAESGKLSPLYSQYLKEGSETDPISFRHLLRPIPAETPLDLDRVENREQIFAKFGSGAMSFGAINAESQRDILLAMKEIGGRSNSGEGGENPFYYTDGITAHTKQIASGRFGVTAEYLVTGQEIQIKIAQGAKPGEGGQLMAVKVDEDIARARFSDPQVDLISPPPMHDIYSIEDLKQLIYEVRQLKSDAKVSVKLVSGEGIGTIAVGVVKAGADLIQISGHDGGTGASALSSMKHAGIPWELGLWESHRALIAQNIRQNVTLRVDGALYSGRDIVTAALLGAEQYDFGKLLLVAEGCIMARICEKNTCPTGIATHNPKFKRLYRGSKDRIIELLAHIAEDVRIILSEMGVNSLRQIVGCSDRLEIDPKFSHRVENLNLDLSCFMGQALPISEKQVNPFIEKISSINAEISGQILGNEKPARTAPFTFAVGPADRAVMATVNGKIALDVAKNRRIPHSKAAFPPTSLEFYGSAGQGFAVFMQEGLTVRLFGEANDSVAKSMSGGKVVINPSPQATFSAPENSIIGNCALYGATGGTLFVNGMAGARFAVRNSGATSVVESVGMHACEYMTRGTVVILGECGSNVGAGMTGGELFFRKEFRENLNSEYIVAVPCDEADEIKLRALLTDYLEETGSKTARECLNRGREWRAEFYKALPFAKANRLNLAISESRLVTVALGAEAAISI
jgi:glutamate synthase domain-containing protein 2/glutamate synthase domain-containing protein 1/glutamate synthase domain-containing protein 3